MGEEGRGPPGWPPASGCASPAAGTLAVPYRCLLVSCCSSPHVQCSSRTTRRRGAPSRTPGFTHTTCSTHGKWGCAAALVCVLPVLPIVSGRGGLALRLLIWVAAYRYFATQLYLASIAHIQFSDAESVVFTNDG